MQLDGQLGWWERMPRHSYATKCVKCHGGEGPWAQWRWRLLMKDGTGANSESRAQREIEAELEKG